MCHIIGENVLSPHFLLKALLNELYLSVFAFVWKWLSIKPKIATTYVPMIQRMCKLAIYCRH